LELIQIVNTDWEPILEVTGLLGGLPSKGDSIVIDGVKYGVVKTDFFITTNPLECIHNVVVTK